MKQIFGSNKYVRRFLKKELSKRFKGFGIYISKNAVMVSPGEYSKVWKVCIFKDKSVTLGNVYHYRYWWELIPDIDKEMAEPYSG